MRSVSPVAVLRTQGVARLLGSSLLGRIPSTAIGLLLILRVRDLGGSYAVGGLAAGAFSLGLAASSPLLGRAVDTRGQTRVLQLGAWVSALALVALALLPDSAPAAAVTVLAFVCGAAHPPLSACMRTLWGSVLPDADARHAAFALEASAQELCFIFGPLLLVSAVAVHDPSAALVLSAAILLAGTLAFVATTASREWRGVVHADGAVRARALDAAGVRTLLVVGAGMGCSFGAIEVGIAASAEAAGSRGAIGILLAVWGVGSIIGGVWAARHGAPADRAARIVTLLLVLAACDALLLAAGPLWALGLALTLCGAAIAPLFTIVYSLAGDLATGGTVTEVFTWLGTGLSAGVAAGAAVAGVLVEGPMGPSGGFVVAAVMVAGAGLAARVRVRTLAFSTI
ncbi:MAG: transporter [Solirubrobacterales bacterium]|nr:transporter [Solirubrobacterales bacterium]